IIAVILILVDIAVMVIIHKKYKNSVFNVKAIHYCTECESKIELEQKVCSNCGAENIKRKEALEELEKLEKSIEENKNEIIKKSQSKKHRTPRNRKLDERFIQILNKKDKEVKKRKMEILIGKTLEAKINWVNSQYYDMSKSIREISEALGEDLFTVRRYIDSDSQNDIQKTVAPSQERRERRNGFYKREPENLTKTEEAHKTLYLMRISKEINENGKEIITKTCANCGEKNKFKEVEGNIFQCLTCGANHYIRE
ncbi:MAG: hypothetical protein ACFFBE_18260, partial [Promethearchaeota archaeon]